MLEPDRFWLDRNRGSDLLFDAFRKRTGIRSGSSPAGMLRSKTLQADTQTPLWPIAQGLKLGNDTPMLASSLVLGIEPTCDEPAAAVIERQSDGTGRILSNVVHSQTE